MPRILWINPINIFHPTGTPHPYQLYHSFPWCIRCVLLQISWTTCPSLIYNHKGQTWFNDPLQWGRLHTNRTQTKEKIEFYKIEGKGGVSEKFKESRILTGIKQGCVKAYGLQSGFQILFSWKPQSQDKPRMSCTKTLLLSFSLCQSDFATPGKNGVINSWCDLKQETYSLSMISENKIYLWVKKQ